MRSISIITLLACALGLSAAPAELSDEPVVGFPGYAELGRRPRDPNEVYKPPEVNKETQLGGRNLEGWIKFLKDSHDPSERERAVLAIAAYGTTARDYAWAALLECVKDTDTGVRAKTILVLAMIGVPEKEKHRLVDVLGDKIAFDAQEVVRYHAAWLLGKLASDEARAAAAAARAGDPAPTTYTKAAILKLVQGSTDERSWEVRKMCLFTLGEVGTFKDTGVSTPVGSGSKDTGPDMRAVHAAIFGLKDKCSEVRMEAATTLFALGVPTNERDKAGAIDALKQAVAGEKKPEVAIWMYMTQMGLEGYKDESLKLLAGYFTHQDPLVREQAITAMGTLGKEALPRIGDLITALDDPEAPVVYAAIVAIANVGSLKDKVMDALNDVPKREFPKPIAEALRRTAAGAIDYLNKQKKGSGTGAGSGSGSGSRVGSGR